MISHWIQTQQTLVSLCLRGTEGWRLWIRSRRILIIQTDLISILRFCVERVWLDIATGRLNIRGRLIYQWHIKESAGKDGVMTVGLDAMKSLGVWPVFTTVFTAKHNNGSTDIKHRAPSRLSNRVGVYVDWSAGRLSFYSVSDTHTLTHLHTFNTTFTEPLYAGFEVYSDSSVSLCKITPLPVKKTSWHSWDSHYLCL